MSLNNLETSFLNVLKPNKQNYPALKNLLLNRFVKRH